MVLGTVFLGGLCAVVAASWLVVKYVGVFMMRRAVLDMPNERSSHELPIPLGGGIAIVAAGLLAVLAIGIIHLSISLTHALVFVGCGLVLALVSLLDDLRNVSYRVRLVVQAATAATFIGGFTYWHAISLPLVGTITLGAFGLILTFLWMVGLINAYNFMDGIDGMAGGQAVAAGAGWMVLGQFTHHPLLTILGAVLAAASLGFLIHNWHPATIFMGDTGSTFLGYCFAVLPIVAAQYDPRFVLAGALLVWPAIFDSGFTVIRRVAKRQGIFAPHRTFLFHRLILAGWSHSQASSFYLVLPILGGVMAYTWSLGTPVIHTAVAAAVICACLSLWLVVCRAERRIQGFEHRTMPQVALAEAAVTGVPDPGALQPQRALVDLYAQTQVRLGPILPHEELESALADAVDRFHELSPQELSDTLIEIAVALRSHSSSRAIC